MYSILSSEMRQMNGDRLRRKFDQLADSRGMRRFAAGVSHLSFPASAVRCPLTRAPRLPVRTYVARAIKQGKSTGPGTSGENDVGRRVVSVQHDGRGQNGTDTAHVKQGSTCAGELISMCFNHY